MVRPSSRVWSPVAKERNSIDREATLTAPPSTARAPRIASLLRPAPPGAARYPPVRRPDQLATGPGPAPRAAETPPVLDELPATSAAGPPADHARCRTRCYAPGQLCAPAPKAPQTSVRVRAPDQSPSAHFR